MDDDSSRSSTPETLTVARGTTLAVVDETLPAAGQPLSDDLLDGVAGGVADIGLRKHTSPFD